MDKRKLNRSLWGNVSVGLKLATFPTLVIFAVAGLLGYMVAVIHQSKSDALVIDMAGRQRMLNQRHLKEILLSSHGFEADYYFTRQIFNETLEGLTNGGSILVNIETGEKVLLPPATGVAVREKLGENQRLMRQFTEEADKFMQLPENSSEYQSKLKELFVLEAKLHEVANELVKLLTEQAESRITTMIRWNAAIAFIVAMLGILYWRLSTVAVIKPLTKITNLSKKIHICIAEGTVPDERVDITTSDEIGQMGVIFNEMVDSIARHIAQRKKTEEKLRQAHQGYEELVNSIEGIVWEADARNFQFSFVSKQAERLLGYPTQMWTSEPTFWQDHIHPDDREKSVALCKKAIVEKRAHEFEYRMIVSNGSPVWLRDIVTVIVQDDQPVKLRGIMIDITERKQMEKMLRESEEKYRTIVETSHDLICTTDLKGRFTFVNQRGTEITGYNIDSVVGTNSADFIHPEDLSHARKHFLKVIHQGKAQTCELRIKDKNGKYVTLQVTEIPIFKNGDIAKIMAFGSDITERKRAEEESRRMNLGIESAGESIIMTDMEGTIQYVNPAFTKLTGYAAEEAVGQNIKILNSGRQSRQFYKDMWETIISREVWSGELVNRRKDGTLYDADLTIAPVFAKRKRLEGFVAVHSDITEQVQNRKKLKKALQQAQQADRVKTLFLENISHEIRTPLNTILGFTDLIEQNVSHLVGPIEQDFFSTVRHSGERLMRTIHEILDISQLETGTLELHPIRLNLGEIVEKTLQKFKPIAEQKGLESCYHKQVEYAPIKADEFCITQAITNLIDNAIKYTEKGKVNISLIHKKNKLRLVIQDTGVGMSEDYLENLYGIFSQESVGYTKEFQGLGLSLAITKRYLDLNKVAIDVESKKGVGTKFTLTFKCLKLPNV